MISMKKINILTAILFFVTHSYSSNAQPHQDSVVITNMGNVINSKNEEYAPVISADGNMLMFTTKRPSTAKKKTKKVYEQVWYCEYNDTLKKWSKAKPLI